MRASHFIGTRFEEKRSIVLMYDYGYVMYCDGMMFLDIHECMCGFSSHLVMYDCICLREPPP